MKIFSSVQIRAIEAATLKQQDSSALALMERAGTAVFNLIHQRLQGAPLPIHVFCGIGNNGGDGLVVSRLLLDHGYKVKTYIVNFSDKRSPGFLENYDQLMKVSKDWPAQLKSEEDFPKLSSEDMVIDAILGIGLNKPLVAWVSNLIKHINKVRAFTLAIDIPSGLYLDKGPEDADAVIYANTTLTFEVPKLVFFLPKTGIYTQDLEVISIGLDLETLQQTKAQASLIGKQEVLPIYRPREKYKHKGDYGHALLIGGSYGMVGSMILATKAVLRIGAGLVTSLVPKCGYIPLQTAIPEAMVLPAMEETLLTTFDYELKPTVVGIGPGLGTAQETVQAFEAFLKKNQQPLVIDADGLNILASHPKILELLPSQTILTPHAKELERLIGVWNDDFDKIEKVKVFSKKYDCIVVIKGANTITVAGDDLYVNTTGNPGMATAGSGDVLLGVLTGLIAQGYDPLQATIFGVYLHGSAGDLSVQGRGYQSVLASDMVTHLGPSYLELFKKPTPQPEA